MLGTQQHGAWHLYDALGPSSHPGWKDCSSSSLHFSICGRKRRKDGLSACIIFILEEVYSQKCVHCVFRPPVATTEAGRASTWPSGFCSEGRYRWRVLRAASKVGHQHWLHSFSSFWGGSWGSNCRPCTCQTGAVPLSDIPAQNWLIHSFSKWVAYVKKFLLIN